MMIVNNRKILTNTEKIGYLTRKNTYFYLNIVNKSLQSQKPRKIVLQHRTVILPVHLRERDKLPASRPVGGPVFGPGPLAALRRRGSQRASGRGAGVRRVCADCVAVIERLVKKNVYC